jgi:four helix bundle protein
MTHQVDSTQQVRSYRDLTAWQKGMDLVTATYTETTNLPAEERFGLTMQMRRCAVSIPSNIAEGWGRRSQPDYLRFLKMACGSTHELCTQSEICKRLNMPGNWDRLLDTANEVGRIINGLINAIERR